MRAQPGAQQRPNTFHGVDVDFAEAVAIFVSGILAPTMVDGLVAETPLRQSAIDRVLVGVDQAAKRNAGQEQWLDRSLPKIGGFSFSSVPRPGTPFNPRRRPARLFSPPPPADLCGPP